MEAALVPLVPSLDELAATIREEHRCALAAAVSSLAHAIRAGEALLAARQQVPRGRWERWLDEHAPEVSRMSRQYMRLATYRDMIPPEVRTAIDAQKTLRGLPAFDGQSGPQRHPPEVRAEAVRLWTEGVSARLIATALGIDHKCVGRWVRQERGELPARRDGEYRTGRPSRREQRRREEIVSRARKAPIGPLALANAFRMVVDANRSGTEAALIDALRDLAKTATAWADQIARRTAP